MNINVLLWFANLFTNLKYILINKIHIYNEAYILYSEIPFQSW